MMPTILSTLTPSGAGWSGGFLVSTSTRATGWIPHSSFGAPEAGSRAPLFFVDGDHTYGSVLRELTGIADAVPDAAVLVHDAFHQSSPSGYNIGPYQAVEAVLANWPGRYRTQHSGLGLPGLTLLYDPSSGLASGKRRELPVRP